MTVSCVASSDGKAAEDSAASGGKSKLEWLVVLLARLRAWREFQGPRITLDDLSEGQLEDVGFSRIGRRARWLDCQEAPFPMDYERYLPLRGPSFRGERHE